MQILCEVLHCTHRKTLHRNYMFYMPVTGRREQVIIDNSHSLRGRVLFSMILLDFVASGRDRNKTCLTIARECMRSVADMLGGRE